MRRAALLSVLLTVPAAAADRPLTGAEIAMLLPRIVAVGDDVAQTFDADGTATSRRGADDQRGRWEVRGDRYCSLWPPATAWTCFDVYARGGALPLPSGLAFAGEDGRFLVFTLRKKDGQP